MEMHGDTRITFAVFNTGQRIPTSAFKKCERHNRSMHIEAPNEGFHPIVKDWYDYPYEGWEQRWIADCMEARPSCCTKGH